jgi:FdhD protein
VTVLRKIHDPGGLLQGGRLRDPRRVNDTDLEEPPGTSGPDSEESAAGTSRFSITRFGEAGEQLCDDAVVREEPLEIQLAGASLSVVMRTPGHDRELATGFLVTERVVERLEQVESVRHASEARDPAAVDNVMRVVLAADVAVDFESLRRNFYSNSSCGVCGKASIDNALAHSPPLSDDCRFPPEFFVDLVDRLEGAQAIFDRTGGLHAAGLFGPDGQLLVAREDVGRHNAVDKVIGWALLDGRVPLAGHVLLVSGRVSYEIVQKARTAGVPVVAAVSAPTSLAIEFAAAAGLTLLGFLRGRGFNVYCGRERIGPG